MEELLAALAEKGIDGSNMDEKQRLKVAKAVGVDPTKYLPRTVELVEHTNQRGETNTFVKTSAFVVGKKSDGTAQTVRGLFLRESALDQAIDDLTTARGLRDAQSDFDEG